MAGVLDSIEDGEKDGGCLITVREEQKRRLPREDLEARTAIRDYVLRTLGGFPEDYLGTDVLPAFDGFYRVNIRCRRKNTIVRPHSFFIRYAKGIITVSGETPFPEPAPYDNHEGHRAMYDRAEGYTS